MLEVTVLGSGSRGNATLLRSSRSSILVDAGFSRRQLVQRLAITNWNPDDLDGIVISHEHMDHICGLRVLNKYHPQTVYAAEGTINAEEVQRACLHHTETIAAGEKFIIGDFTITPFTIPHDAADPLGFIIEVEGIRLGHVTDIGFPTELVRHHLGGCHVIILESNHDRTMLIEGSYPWPVKQRIMSRMGHLENSDAAGLLADVVHADLQAVLLAHLSQENNTAELARATAEEAVRANGNGAEPRVIVTSQFEPSETIRL
jgi:phosphoribosyl 1,2-cyclic phosphodiesterase